jgi:hypothetical protein
MIGPNDMTHINGNGLIAQAEISRDELIDYRAELWSDLFEIKDPGIPYETFEMSLINEFDYLVEIGEISLEGRSWIFIQPAGDGCQPEVYQYQAVLQGLSDEIDELLAETEWLQGQLNECCLDVIPDYQALYAEFKPELEECETCRDDALDSLYVMEAQIDEPSDNGATPDNFKNRMEGLFLADVQNGDATIAPRDDIVIPTIPDLCPEEAHTYYLKV